MALGKVHYPKVEQQQQRLTPSIRLSRTQEESSMKKIGFGSKHGNRIKKKEFRFSEKCAVHFFPELDSSDENEK